MPLDDAGLAFIVPDFLTTKEIEGVLQHAEDVHSEKLLIPNERYCFAELSANSTADVRSHHLLAALEQRVARLVGIEPHQEESPFMVAVSRPWVRAYEGEQSTLQNLHHDQNTAPGRVATVLVYLTGTGDEDPGDEASLAGGETYFPCVRTKESGDEEELCRRLSAGYSAGERILWPSAYPDSFDPAAADMADAACRRLRDSAASEAVGGVAVRPRLGAALLFFSAKPDSAGSFVRAAKSGGLSHMWHGGCRVWRGEK